VERRTNTWRRLVIPDLIDPIHNFNSLHRAPAGHEGARERRVREADREGIIHHASRARRGRGPPIGTTICVQPCDDQIEPTAQTFRQDCDPFRMGNRRSASRAACCAAFIEQPGRSRSDVPRVGSPALSDGDPVISKTGFGSTRQRAQRDLGNPFELRTACPARRLDRHTFQNR